METDPDKLRQILLNVLHQRGEFHRPKGVTLRAEVTNGQAVLQVNDTGIGISRGDEERILEPFWQVEQGGHPQSRRDWARPHRHQAARLLATNALYRRR